MREVGSQRGYARRKGVSHRAVQKAIAAGRIPSLPDGRLDYQECDLAWERNTARRANGCAANGAAQEGRAVSLVQEQQRLVGLRADLAALRLARERGELVERALVVRELLGPLLHAREGVAHLPMRLRATLAHKPPDVIESALRVETTAILRRLDGELAGLHQRLGAGAPKVVGA